MFRGRDQRWCIARHRSASELHTAETGERSAQDLAGHSAESENLPA